MGWGLNRTPRIQANAPHFARHCWDRDDAAAGRGLLRAAVKVDNGPGYQSRHYQSQGVGFEGTLIGCSVYRRLSRYPAADVPSGTAVSLHPCLDRMRPSHSCPLLSVAILLCLELSEQQPVNPQPHLFTPTYLEYHHVSFFHRASRARGGEAYAVPLISEEGTSRGRNTASVGARRGEESRCQSARDTEASMTLNRLGNDCLGIFWVWGSLVVPVLLCRCGEGFLIRGELLRSWRLYGDDKVVDVSDGELRKPPR